MRYTTQQGRKERDMQIYYGRTNTDQIVSTRASQAWDAGGRGIMVGGIIGGDGGRGEFSVASVRVYGNVSRNSQREG